MIRFYNSREVARKLDIPLARWKRWSREFLPPDPLGGLRSGYARQYSVAQAFKVYLGGHLVAVEKFSVPDARRILEDLEAWLAEKGFYGGHGRRAAERELESRVSGYQVYVFRQKEPGKNTVRFFYRIKGTMEGRTLEQGSGWRIREERYLESFLGPEGILDPESAPVDLVASEDCKMFPVSALFSAFCGTMSI